jgi:hypothetical protein
LAKVETSLRPFAAAGLVFCELRMKVPCRMVSCIQKGYWLYALAICRTGLSYGDESVGLALRVESSPFLGMAAFLELAK